jgi:aminopeptidase N
MSPRAALLTLALFALPAAAQSPSPTPPEPLRSAGDRPIDIAHIRLDLKVDLPKKTVDAVATLDITALRPLTSFALDAVGFEVSAVTLRAKDNGNGGDGKVGFRHDGQKLAIDLPAEWNAGKAGTLAVTYRVREPKDGLFFFGPTPAEPDVPFTVWSQGEAITNRHWIPCLDHPAQRQTTELVVTVAGGYEVLSNGRRLAKKPNGDGTTTFHWKQDQPHVSYLVTLVVGKFDVVEEKWGELPVSYWVPPGRRDDAARTFGRTREMLDLFTRKFGVAYPWEKYAQVTVEQFTGGGMENTSATTLTEKALHDQRAFLDSNADRLIAHELAHQWWGDLVTCRDWAHLWLNEGFASFCEVVWLEHTQGGADESAYELFQKAKAAIKGGKDRPVVDRRYPHPRLMFDARAYPKGAWVLHMLRRHLGEDGFWKGVREYGTEHRLKSVETSDFRRTLERVTGRPLERFFYDWTERPGHPVLEVVSDYVSDSKQVRVRVKQTQPGEAFHFPLKVRLATGPTDPAAGSAANVARTEVILVTEKEQTAYLPAAAGPTELVIDPDLELLAEITEQKGRDLWAAQLTSQSVAAAARAAAHLGKSKMPADRELLAKALTGKRFWGVKSEIAAALAASGGDACRDALIAGLSDAHPKVRRACAEHLGAFRNDEKAAAALKALLARGDASYFVEATAVASYGKLARPDTVGVVLPWLAKPSHNDVIRSASLVALGESGDLAALDTLLAWSGRGKPRGGRASALEGLAKLAKKANPGEEQRKAIVTAVAACLEGEHPLTRRAAIEALRELGRGAEPKLDVLEHVSRHDPDPRIAELARKAVESVRSSGPPPVELSRLREELERLRQANETLRDRLDRVERK